MKIVSQYDASNLSNLLKDGYWMVLYYAEWCGHCKTMKPEWEKVVSKMKDTGKVNIAEVESNWIEHLKDKPEIEGYPTIKMYNCGKEVAKFEDERVADKMEKFALSNSKTLKNNANAKEANKIEVNTKLVENKLEKLIEEKLDNKLDNKLENKIKSMKSKESSSELPMIPITNLQQSHLSKKYKKHNSIVSAHVNTLDKQPKNEEHNVNHNSKYNSKKLLHSSMKYINSYKSKSEGKVSNMKTPVKELKIDDLLTIKENNIPKPNIKKYAIKKAIEIKPQANLSCDEIIKAKTCKSNPKCVYDYTEYKCKDNLAVTTPKLNTYKSKTHKNNTPSVNKSK